LTDDKKEAKRKRSRSRAAADADAGPRYFIDKEGLKASGSSYQFLLYSRLCRRGGCGFCGRQDAGEQMRTLPKASELEGYIRKHCFKQDDYPSERAALLELVFLLLVRNGKPMSVKRIEELVFEIWAGVSYLKNRSSGTLERTLDGPNLYGIRRYEK